MKALTTITVALVTTCSLLGEVQSTEMKVKVYLLDNSNITRVSTVMFEAPCKDDKVNDKELKEVIVGNIKNSELSDLHKLREQTKFYSSVEVSKDIVTLIEKKVVGTEHSALEFINKMIEEKCNVYLLGGAVRDVLMGKMEQVNDIDIDTNCDVNKIDEVCKKHFDNKHCFKKESVFHFGSEAHKPERLDVAINKDTFETPKLTCVEYSPNALAYEYGTDNVIVDFTGGSVTDVCTKKIRIPVGKDDMDAWAAERGDDGGKKIFRYWKMRGKGFTKGNEETEEYVVKKAKEYIKNDDWIKMKKYYCYLIYDVKTLIEDNAGCNVAKDVCENQSIQLKATNFKKGVTEDLKDWKLPRCGKFTQSI